MSWKLIKAVQLTKKLATVTAHSVRAARGTSVVSVACKTGCGLGPAAVTAGIVAWLGFTINVLIIPPNKTIDPIGDAIVSRLAGLGNQSTMQSARDAIAVNLTQLADDYDTGVYQHHPASSLGYYGALALADHVVVHGRNQITPLP